MTAARDSATTSKDAILDAATELIARVGYDAASIAQICKESGLPNGSVYHHFGNKAGILTAIVERGAARFFGGIAPAKPAGETTAEQRMREYWLAAADGVYENFEFLVVEGDLLRYSVRDPEIRLILERAFLAYRKQFLDVIVPFAREVGVEDPDALAERLCFVMSTYSRGLVTERIADRDRIRARIGEFFEILRCTILEQGRIDTSAKTKTETLQS